MSECRTFSLKEKENQKIPWGDRSEDDESIQSCNDLSPDNSTLNVILDDSLNPSKIDPEASHMIIAKKDEELIILKDDLQLKNCELEELKRKNEILDGQVKKNDEEQKVIMDKLIYH